MSDTIENSAPKPKCKAITIAAVSTPLIAGGLYLAWNYTSRFWKKRSKPKERRHLARSVSFATLHGGKLALQRMLDYHHFRADETELDSALSELKSLIKRDQPNFKDLQVRFHRLCRPNNIFLSDPELRVLMKIEMTRKEDEAVKELQKALEKAKKENKYHEEYEFEMLLVEMYIYKGDFEKAMSCKCLHEKQISDARRPLYKAIIHCLLKPSRCQVVQHYWQKFKEARTHLLLSPETEEHDHFYKILTDFDQFEKVVSVLEKDIQEARRLKTQ